MSQAQLCRTQRLRNRGSSWSVRVPRRAKELHLRLGQTQPALTQRLGRAPTIAELAAEMSITEDEVLQAMEAGSAYRSSSLEARSNDSGESAMWVQRLGHIDSAFENTDYRLLIESLLEKLPERERTIIQMRFFDEMTQSEIAESVGVSQMHVSRLLSRILGELRSRMTEAI